MVDGENEEILDRYEYDAWGNLTTCEEKVPNRFKFNGQQYDPVSQQYYLRARYYNPVIGRFTQEDTYRGDGLNLYAYCRDNPVYYVDPSGHIICKVRANELIEKLFSRGGLSDQERSQLSEFLYYKEQDATNGGLTAAEKRAFGQVDKNKRVYEEEYPPRTEQARRMAQEVAKAMEAADISRKKNPSVTVFTHEDGTISIGMSGRPGTQGMNEQIRKLKSELDKRNIRCFISAESIPIIEIDKKEKGNAPGECSEPKAAYAASQNPSRITGMDTVYRGTGVNLHKFDGENVGGPVEGDYEQMKPCPTCGDPKNIRAYMRYANKGYLYADE